MLPTSIKTKVIKGKGRGRKIGIPTVNCTIPKNFFLKHGVYAGWISFDGRRCMAAIHFGPSPVFDDFDVSLEVHVLKKRIKPVDEFVVLEFLKYIRTVKDFENTSTMISEIKNDIRKIKLFLDT